MRGLTWALLCCLSSLSWANEAFLKQEVVEAKTVDSLPFSPLDAGWEKAPVQTFRASVQRAVYLHDKKANAVVAQPGNFEIQVQAVVKGTTLLIRLEWPDASKDVVRTDEVNVFADSVALQMPQKFGAGMRLPAISMGDEDMPVRMQLLRATANGALFSNLVAAGFGSSTREAAAMEKTNVLEWNEKTHKWSAQFETTLSTAEALVPVSFAFWDGARMERSGYKRLTSWHFIRQPQKSLNETYVKELAYGYTPGDLGKAEMGKALVQALCSACHHLPEMKMAPQGMAPSLVGVGAVNTPSYLRDSVLTPNQVVVHAPNPNQHYDARGSRDKQGAASNSEIFQWSIVGADGKRVSKMPPFAHLPTEQIADIVAYLKTLEGEMREVKQ